MSGFALRGLGDYFRGLGDSTDSADFLNPLNQALAPIYDTPGTTTGLLSSDINIDPGTTTGLLSSDINFTSPSVSNLAASLAQQWTNITGKILQQTTVPAGQIQITGPNGQSEIIQTNANTAGIGIPGLTTPLSGSSSWLIPLAALAAIIAIVSWGHK